MFYILKRRAAKQPFKDFFQTIPLIPIQLVLGLPDVCLEQIPGRLEGHGEKKLCQGLDVQLMFNAVSDVLGLYLISMVKVMLIIPTLFPLSKQQWETSGLGRRLPAIEGKLANLVLQNSNKMFCLPF